MEVKELSIEEKARRYDEAIEGIQEILSSGQDYIKMSRLQLRLQGIFPELKEDRDERIRKNLIELFHDTVSNDEILRDYGLDKTETLAWLEKQGEQKIAEWSEDDEQYLLVCKNALAEYQVSNKWDARIISHWLENKLEVSRNRWRPSDEHIDRLIWVINRLPNTKRAKETKAVIEDLIEQLKKLRMKGGKK